MGSLGQYAGETDIVENVFIRNISMSDAQNGARIKVRCLPFPPPSIADC